MAHSLLRPQLDLHVQRILLPYHENFLFLPSITLVHLLKVELPKKVGENESHFQVREIAAEAISRPDGEGIERGTRRARFQELLVGGEPAVRVERGRRIWEVQRRVVGCVAWAGYECLAGMVSLFSTVWRS